MTCERLPCNITRSLEDLILDEVVGQVKEKRARPFILSHILNCFREDFVVSWCDVLLCCLAGSQVLFRSSFYV